MKNLRNFSKKLISIVKTVMKFDTELSRFANQFREYLLNIYYGPELSLMCLMEKNFPLIRTYLEMKVIYRNNSFPSVVTRVI